MSFLLDYQSMLGFAGIRRDNDEWFAAGFAGWNPIVIVGIIVIVIVLIIIRVIFQIIIVIITVRHGSRSRSINTRS